MDQGRRRRLWRGFPDETRVEDYYDLRGLLLTLVDGPAIEPPPQGGLPLGAVYARRAGRAYESLTALSGPT